MERMLKASISEFDDEGCQIVMSETTIQIEDLSEQELCKACGLCCDGTIFGTVSIGKADEIDGLEKVGAQFVTTSKDRYFELPCPAHQNGICKIYIGRPSACRKYECKLLKRCLDDEVAWDKALEIIKTTQAHKQRVETEIRSVYDPSGSKNLPELYKGFEASCGGETGPIAFRKKYRSILVLYAALRLRIEKYFEDRK